MAAFYHSILIENVPTGLHDASCCIMAIVTISEAVKELRKALGESQQAFATRLGLYISSVAHYEGADRAPDYLVTLKLYRAACDADRKDLAAFFLQLINAGIVPKVAVPFQSESERESIQALQAILYDARFEHLREPLEELLAPVKAHLSRIAKRNEKKKGQVDVTLR
jgi:transcriptional regulator with XRE-family HTH domain